MINIEYLKQFYDSILIKLEKYPKTFDDLLFQNKNKIDEIVKVLDINDNDINDSLK